MPTKSASSKAKAKAEDEQTKAASTESITPDPAPGKEKVDESLPAGQMLAAGGGSEVFMGTPLVEGIPVVVPITDALAKQTNAKTVMGVALAAPVVPGMPEMIHNAQAEHAVENPDWAEGDIKSIHTVPGGGEIQVDVVQADGSTKTERHRANAEQIKGFEQSFQDPKSWKKASKAFYSKTFDKDTLIEDPQ